jgi:hypothetical protein
VSSLVKYAKRELERIGAFSKERDFYEGMTGKAVMELIEVFAKQRHSGMSAYLVLQIFEKVANFEPLQPLTGEDSEWNKPGLGGDELQNNRCSHVFKRMDGTAYDSKGRVFVEPDGSAYTSRNSLVDITFPYTPKTEHVHVGGVK